MNILSLNVHGIRSSGKVGWIKGLKTNQGVDFLAVQESKISAPPSWLLAKCWGNSAFMYDCVDSDGTAGGLISWWDPAVFSQTGCIKSRHVLIVSGDMINAGIHVNIANVHAPNDVSDRRRFWNDLLFYRRTLLGRWILLGDFNEVRSINERVNSDFSLQNAIHFNNVIEEADLFEYNMGGHSFIYMSSDGVKLSKLDRCLVDNEIMVKWPNAVLTALPRHLSDHSPLLLALKSLDYGHTPFRFYNSWLQIPGFVEFVNSIADKFMYDGPADIALATKLKWLKGRIRMWIDANRRRREVNYQSSKKLVLDLESTADNRLLTEAELEQRVAARKIVFEEERMKCLDAQQKSRTRWALDGDENSKYFHGILKMNMASNRIHGVRCDGVWIDDPVVVKEKVEGFFSNKFSFVAGPKPPFIIPDVAKLTNDDVILLDAPFSVEEISAAVFDCDGGKAPGPDGFNFTFIQKFWPILKADFIKMFEEFFDNGYIQERCFSAFIALIPKGKSKATLADYRPISLVGILNKVLPKVLMMRLKGVLPRLISEEQTTFICGRNILDGPLILNETVAWLKKMKRKAFFLKVDIEKLMIRLDGIS